MFRRSNAWRGRTMIDSARHGKMPLADAAEIARLADRLARKGMWMQQWARALAEGHPMVPAFLAVTWSKECYDAEVIPGGKDGWPDFSSGRNMRERFFAHPLLLVPISQLYVEVWTKSAAMLAEDNKAKDA